MSHKKSALCLADMARFVFLCYNESGPASGMKFVP